MQHSSVAIGFAKDLVPLVKNGTKTLTYRLGDKYDFLEIGDKIPVKDSATGEIFAEVEITEKSFTTFQDLPIDRKGHEVYKSKEHQREVFKQYYQEVNEEDKVLVLGFNVVRFIETV